MTRDMFILAGLVSWDDGLAKRLFVMIDGGHFSSCCAAGQFGTQITDTTSLTELHSIDTAPDWKNDVVSAPRLTVLI
jgi:hypothetical protein